MISVNTGVSPTVSGADGARAVGVADQIVEAIERREWYRGATPREIGSKAFTRERIENRVQGKDDRRAA